MDEGEVDDILTASWTRNALDLPKLGKYAIFAENSETWNGDLPTVLICAHMDSPGYIVESIGQSGITFVTLGGAAFEEDEIDLVLKTGSGKFTIPVCKVEDGGYESFHVPPGVKVGDRACFVPEVKIEDGIIEAPFLDNRLGCFILTLLAEKYDFMRSDNVNIVLGATSSEEMGGFGAPVLAEYLQPDFVIVLDATYASKKQNITLGGGGVLTLSDNSVILSPAERDDFAAIFSDAEIPYQFEVYNYSGTDAKAFPLVGGNATVRAFLIATENNHHFNERAALIDIENTTAGIKLMVNHYLDGIDKTRPLCD
jgi:putative aminopeptidase FrvX